MKSKQLANVLIKIIGLYVCVSAIPGIISTICVAVAPLAGTTLARETLRWAPYAIGYAVQTAVGIVLIVQSRPLAGYWFKPDDE
jgi:hypothetical protein